MDYREFVGAHRAAGADITVAALPCAEEQAQAFGLMKIDDAGRCAAAAVGKERRWRRWLKRVGVQLHTSAVVCWLGRLFAAGGKPRPRRRSARFWAVYRPAASSPLPRPPRPTPPHPPTLLHPPQDRRVCGEAQGRRAEAHAGGYDDPGAGRGLGPGAALHRLHGHLRVQGLHPAGPAQQAVQVRRRRGGASVSRAGVEGRRGGVGVLCGGAAGQREELMGCACWRVGWEGRLQRAGWPHSPPTPPPRHAALPPRRPALPRSQQHDFGSDIIPGARELGYKVQAHLFKGYWEDIGTVRAFYESNLALTDSPNPKFRCVCGRGGVEGG